MPAKIRAAAKTSIVRVTVVSIVSADDGHDRVPIDTVTDFGTGFVVADHLVVTANHVVNPSRESGRGFTYYFSPQSRTVYLAGKTFACEVVDFDSLNDIALLKVIDGEDKFTGGVPIAFHRKLELLSGKGKPWIAFGFLPRNVLVFREFGLFEGYVNGIGDPGIESVRQGIFENPAQPGFSGGPALDKNGYFLGLVARTYPVVAIFNPAKEVISFLEKNHVKYRAK